MIDMFVGSKGQGGMDGGIRVPTVAMWPGRIPPKTVIDIPTSQMDVFSTLLTEVWGEPLPTDRVIDGRNIYPLLAGNSTAPPHPFLFHYCGPEIHAARYTPPGNGRWSLQPVVVGEGLQRINPCFAIGFRFTVNWAIKQIFRWIHKICSDLIFF
jgi:hypothetical protein